MHKEESRFVLDLKVGLVKEVKQRVDVGNVKTIIMAVKHKDLKKVVGELKGAVKAHGRQAETIDQHIKDMGSSFKMKSMLKKTSPALLKLSASCKAAARRKFKVYPSAYANMWASKTQKKGKC